MVCIHFESYTAVPKHGRHMDPLSHELESPMQASHHCISYQYPQCIWFARNQMRFRDKTVNWQSSISSIISNVSLSRNLSNVVASSSISDFTILKKLNISLHPPKASKTIEVVWNPPILNWIKLMVQPT